MQPKTSRTNIEKPYLFPFKKINFMSIDLSIEEMQQDFILKAQGIITMRTMPVLCLFITTFPEITNLKVK